jgi:glucose-1-phosphate adenylyltransferase
MGIYVFTRDVLLDLLRSTSATDFGREIIPAALNTHVVRAYMHDDYWADVGTVEAFYEANIALTSPHAAFKFYDPRRPIFTHERFLPPSHLRSCTVRECIVADGCVLEECRLEQSVIGIRTNIGKGTRITRSVLLGADSYPSNNAAPLGIGCDVVLDRVIIDKNASIGSGSRLTNQAGVEHADGDDYFIRNGLIIIPKGATIPTGTII